MKVKQYPQEPALAGINTPLKLTLALLGCALGSSAYALGDLYNEAQQGDAVSQALSISSTGTKTIRGGVGPAGSDAEDIYEISIASDTKVSQIALLPVGDAVWTSIDMNVCGSRYVSRIGKTFSVPDVSGCQILINVSNSADSREEYQIDIQVDPASTNVAPTLGTNTGLTLDEGTIRAVSTSSLSADDEDDSGTGLTFTVTAPPTNGILFVDGNANQAFDEGEALAQSATFTQQDLIDGVLFYAHDGSETTSDSFGFDLADGGENNAAPVTGNTFVINVSAVDDVPMLQEEAWSLYGEILNAPGAGDLAIDSQDRLLFARQEAFGDGRGASVDIFDGESWGALGVRGFSGGQASRLNIAVDSNDVPHVVYRDEVSDTKRATMKKFDGSQWVTVGQPEFSEPNAVPDDLTFDNNDIPYVAVASGFDLGVTRYVNGSWEYVGAPIIARNGFEATIRTASDGTPYVSFIDKTVDYSADFGMASVKRFNGTNWELVGPADFAAGNVDELVLALDNNDQPYVAFKDKANNDSLTVMTFSENSWRVVGGVAISEGPVEKISLELDDQNSPYVVYQDEVNGGRLSALRFNGQQWQTLGKVGFSEEAAGPTAIFVKSDQTPLAVATGLYGNKVAPYALTTRQVTGFSANYTEDDQPQRPLNQFSVFDPDSVSATVSVTLSNPAAGRLSAIASGDAVVSSTVSTLLTISGTPSDVSQTLASTQLSLAENYNGSATLAVGITDGGGNFSGNIEGTISVAAVNDAPTISGQPASSVNIGYEYFFLPTVNDVDGDSLSVDTNGDTPAWLSVNAFSGKLEGTPAPENLNQSFTVTQTVSDGQLSASLPAFTITVTGPDLDDDGIADMIDEDVDGDGLLNIFEEKYGFDARDESDSAGDRDGDGLSNLDEQKAGTDPTRDDQAPVIASVASITLSATGLLTPLGELTPPEATDALDGQVEVTRAGNRTSLRPGRHALVWEAEDSAGNRANVEQIVDVIPLISLGKDQVQAEGAEASIRFLLNGPSPTYPVTIDYIVGGTMDASDHDLKSGSVTFEEGEIEKTVPVVIADDGMPESQETLVVSLTGTGNFGAKREHVLTVVEGNVAPRLDLSMTQDGEEVRLGVIGGEPLAFVANVTDPNPQDEHTFDWSFPDGAVATDDNGAIQTLEPRTLAPGVYSVEVTVTDNGAPALEAKSVLSFRILDQAPALSAATDSDGDGVDDATEGLTDADRDGQPDYLDSVSLPNVLNSRGSDNDRFLVEADPGVRLSLGKIALANEADGAELSSEQLTFSAGIPPDTVANVGGYFDMTAYDLPTAGANVNIVLPQRNSVPENPVYRKFIDGQWMTFMEDGSNLLASAPGTEGACPPPGDMDYEPGLTKGHWCVQLTIEDGGPNDADGKVNGVVQDPGGVGARGEYTLSSTSSGSGGGGSASPWLLLLGLAASLRRLCRQLALLGAGLVLSISVNAQEPGWLSSDRVSVAGSLMYVTSSQNKQAFSEALEQGGYEPVVHGYDENRLGWAIEVDYRYWQGFSLAAGYVDFGEVEIDFDAEANDPNALRGAVNDAYPASGSGWTLAQAYNHDISPQLRGRVELGLLRWEGEVDFRDNTFDSDVDAETDVFWGVGLDYKVLEQWNAGIQVRRYNVSSQVLMSWGLRASYTF